MEKVGDLSKLHSDLFDVGLRVVAVSREPADVLETKLVKGRGAKFWIGSDVPGETGRNYVAGPGAGYPRYYVVGQDGTVLRDSLPSEAELIAMLERPLVQPPPSHAKLARAAAAFAVGHYGFTAKEAQALTKDADAALAKDADALRKQVSGLAKFRLHMLTTRPDANPNEQFGRLLRFTFQFEGVDGAKAAQAQLDALKRTDQVKRFQAEWSKLEAVLRAEKLAEGKPERFTAVKKQYEDLAKQLNRSLVGRLATEYAAQLQSGAGATKVGGK